MFRNRFAGGLLEGLSRASAALSSRVRSIVGADEAVLQRSDLIDVRDCVQVVLFDFDGTLTATPGEKAVRRQKEEELQQRLFMLEPCLQKLDEAGFLLGILSKSTEHTVVGALEATDLRKYFKGPVTCKAVSLEGKLGFIRDFCRPGGCLAEVVTDATNFEGWRNVLLVDDDVYELERCRAAGVQTYAAPETGGLQMEDFDEIFECLGLPNALKSLCTNRFDKMDTITQLGRSSQDAEQRPSKTFSSLSQRDTRAKFVSEHPIKVAWRLGLVGSSVDKSETSVANSVTYEFPIGGEPSVSEFYSLDFSTYLGSGAFGYVCACKLTDNTKRRADVAWVSEHVVMKLIDIELAGSEYVDHFIKDGGYDFLLRMARECSHHNVCRQFDYIQGPDLVFNVQEALEGPDLLTYMKEHENVTVGVCQHIARDMLSALDHIHSALGVGIIHRDVKPANLRLRHVAPQSDLVLLDFGLSCFANAVEKKSQVGTQLFVAPEVFSEAYGTKVDVWSAGVVFYVLLSGAPPWKCNPRHGFAANRQVDSGMLVRRAIDRLDLANVPAAALQVLEKLLVVEEPARASAADALRCPWFTEATSLHRCLSTSAMDYNTSLVEATQSPTARGRGNKSRYAKETGSNSELDSSVAPPKSSCWSFNGSCCV